MNSYIARHPRIACNPRRTVDAAYLGEISMLATPRVGCPFQNLSLRKKGRIGFNSRDLRERYLRFIVSSFHRFITSHAQPAGPVDSRHIPSSLLIKLESSWGANALACTITFPGDIFQRDHGCKSSIAFYHRWSE